MSQLYIEDIDLGDDVGPLLKEPDRAQLDAYVKAWGTTTGRFVSDEAAQAEGFTGVILPGNMSMGLLAQLLTNWVGLEGKVKRLDVDFRRSILPGDKLNCSGIVTDIQIVDEENQVTLDVYIETQKGERALQGTALVVLPNKG